MFRQSYFMQKKKKKKTRGGKVYLCRFNAMLNDKHIEKNNKKNEDGNIVQIQRKS